MAVIAKSNGTVCGYVADGSELAPYEAAGYVVLPGLALDHPANEYSWSEADGLVHVGPPAPDIQAHYLDCLARLKSITEGLVAAAYPEVYNRYSPSEQASQSEQLTWARSYSTDPTAAAMLGILAGAKGITVDALAASIISNDALWSYIRVRAIGEVIPLRDALDAALATGDIAAMDAVFDLVPTAQDVRARIEAAAVADGVLPAPAG